MIPVIRINFNDGKSSTKVDIQKRISRILKINQRDLGLDYDSGDGNDISFYFNDLIYQTYKKYHNKVVILIDEYDKPILDNIEDPQSAKLMREELKNFYSVIKGADEYIKFVFITGVSKFSKVSLFSGLNNLDDITINPKPA